MDFSTRHWEDRDRDPAYPELIEGCRVLRHMRTRRDTPGSLVLLDDGRYAITGRALAVGAAAQIQRYARRRLNADLQEDERAWWQEVVGALAR